MKIDNVVENLFAAGIPEYNHYAYSSCVIYINCPFCGERGFDLVGLKSHLLNGDCEEFNKIETLTRLF